MPRDDPSPKIGAGHASAMFRQGLSELRGALYPDSNVAQPPQYGLYGTKTPGEVAEARRSEDYAPEISRWEQEGGSILQDRLKQAEASREAPGRDDKSLDKE